MVTETFRDGFFPYDGGAVKEYFERLKGEVSPDQASLNSAGRSDGSFDRTWSCQRKRAATSSGNETDVGSDGRVLRRSHSAE